MTNLTELKTKNQERWNKCSIPLSRGAEFKKVADKLIAPEAKKRYQAVEALTRVPWWFIAVVHQREASQSWEANLAQGDPWNKKSTNVPKGRGPFNSWEEAAVDALTKCSPYAAKNKDWSPGGALTMLEQYNGLGYFNKGIPSPYIWAGTNQYTKGKYIADHVFDPNAVDRQLGCAGLLKFMGIFKKEPSTVTKGTVATASAAIAASVTPTSYWPWIFGIAIVGFMTWIAYSIIKSYMSLPEQKKENSNGIS